MSSYVCSECSILELTSIHDSNSVFLENAIKHSPGNHVLDTSISALGGGSGLLNWFLILQISLLRVPVAFLTSTTLLCLESAAEQLVLGLGCGSRGIWLGRVNWTEEHEWRARDFPGWTWTTALPPLLFTIPRLTSAGGDCGRKMTRVWEEECMVLVLSLLSSVLTFSSLWEGWERNSC